MKRFSLLLVLALPVWPEALQRELPKLLTLEEAMEIAFRQSPVLRRAQAQLQQAEGKAGQARSPLLPQASIGVSDMLQTVNLRALGLDIPQIPARVGPFSVVDVRGYITQNVWNQPAIEQHRAVREQRSAQQALSGNARELLAAQVALAFAQALRAQAAAATLGEQLALARQLLGITEDRYRLGVATLVDVKRAQQQVNNLDQARIEADNSLTAAKLQLANLLHARVTADYQLVPGPAPPLEGLAAEQGLARALESRADYRAAQARTRAAERRVAAVKAQRYPSLQFQGNYGQIGRKPFDNLNTFRIQGTLNVPVYTGGRIAAELVEAQGALAEAQASLDELRQHVETEVRTAVAAVEAAGRQVRVAESTIALARDELELARSRFTAGVADNTEVVNAQDRISRAEDNRVRAQYQLDVAAASLFRALGVAEKTYRRGVITP